MYHFYNKSLDRRGLRSVIRWLKTIFQVHVASRLLPAILRVSVLPSQPNSSHVCKTAPQSSIICRYINPQKKRNSFLPRFSFWEYESVSWKLPRRMSMMSFWLELDHVPTAKPVTSNRTGTTINGFNHSLFTLSHTVEG